ncbi:MULTISPECIES: hypothetical protein [unclassified Flavobacterium]|uniref:hypothetical protein n=1 Tax=unclassified Flavobacterium TaxID=196869 RepID=UPI003607863D
MREHSDRIQKEIQENKVCSVGMVFAIDKKGKNDNIKYYVIHERLMYELSETLPSDEEGEDYRNKYFKIEFSSKHPKYCRIFLDQEVTDQDEISKAGF